jgi:hypothetical protein
MKKQNTTQYLKLLGMVCLGLASMPARAGDQMFNFDTDPSLDPNFILVGANATSAWWGTGGNPASGGYLELTPAVGSQNLCIVFPDVDQGYPVKAFKLTLDARVGNGTTERPADGFSISYCREGDPVLVNATNGVTGGAAGGDDAATTLSAAGSGDLENGTKTGVSVLFDAWAGNWLPDTGADGTPGPDTEGIAVRVDDKTLRQIDMSANRNGGCTYATQPDITVCQAAACTDPNTMQTGPWDGGSGIIDVLCWQPLIVELDTNKQVTVTWKGQVMLDHFQLSQYTAHRGRLVLMGRTGGNNQNVNFDNIHLVTVPAIEATFGSVQGVGLNGFQFTVDDNGISVVTNVPLVKLDGVDVTSQCVVTKSGPTTTVKYTQAANFPSGSKHTVDANWQTTLGQTLGIAGQTFTIIPWATLPESYAVASVDTSRPGFIVQPIQTTAANPNRLYWTDEQLLGRHGDTLLDISGVAGYTNNSYVAWNDVIDFANDLTPGANGQFFHDTDWAYVGIPSGTDPAQNNSSMAVMAYAYFPTAGTYVFGGNSDDGIRLTFAPNSHSLIGLELPGLTADVGRGIGKNQNVGGVIVTKPGYYGFRFLFENGGGGCNVEFYTKQTPALTADLLVNDSTNANSVKVYMVSTAAPPYISDADPVMDNNTVIPTATLKYTITDSGTTVDSSKVTLKVNGNTMSPTVSKSGNQTTVTQPAPANYWPTGTNTVELAYDDNTGATWTASYIFVVAGYSVLDVSEMAPLGSQDTSKPGFVLHTVQIDFATVNDSGDGIPNQMDDYNAIVAGLAFPWYGANMVDTTGAAASNMWYWTGSIDFNVNGSAGDFTDDNLLPGIPGTSLLDNNYAALFQGWLVFPTAGFYRMGVSSDDGFRLSTGFAPIRQVLHVTGNGIDTDVEAVVSKKTDGNGGFGGEIPVTPISAPVVYIDGSTCPDLPDLTGKIGVAQTATCSKSDAALVYAMQQKGAVAAIVINNPTYGYPYRMSGTPEGTVTIPALNVNGFGGQKDFWVTNANLVASIGASQKLQLGAADYGKGMGWIDFGFVAPQAGVYPMHLIYGNGGGGAGLEWSTLSDAGVRTLVNGTDASAVKSFRAVTVAPRPTMSISTVGGVTKITYTGTLQSSATANGTYSDVSGATSPYTVNTGTGNMFFRARN